ncbi:hypothetical protein EDD21DRAFT_428279, partial [Dissophora ornata]
TRPNLYIYITVVLVIRSPSLLQLLFLSLPVFLLHTHMHHYNMSAEPQSQLRINDQIDKRVPPEIWERIFDLLYCNIQVNKASQRDLEFLLKQGLKEPTSSKTP